MRFSTRTRYAARATVELAVAYPHGTVSVRDVAQKLQTSAKYLEHILRALRSAGLVQTVRGAHGGCALAKVPEAITLKDVHEAMEGPVKLVDCVAVPDECQLRNTCPTRDTWTEITESLVEILERTTIQHLVERRNRKLNNSPLMYHI